MAHAQRNVDEIPLFVEFVNQERFAKQLINPFDRRIFASESPGLPEEETQGQPFDLGAEVDARARRKLAALPSWSTQMSLRIED